MKPRALALCLLLMAVSAVTADVTLTSPSVTAVLNDAGAWKSLQGADGQELCLAVPTQSFATVTTPAGSAVCSGASLTGNTLRLDFEKTGTTLTYEVTPAPNWLLLKLTGVSGARPTSMTMCLVPVGLSEKVGRRLNAAYDSQRAVCLLAANRQPDCGAIRGKAGMPTILRALNQDAPGPKLEGAAVALIVCPTSRLRSIVREAGHQFGLPSNEDASGTPVKDTDLPRGSYWFMHLGADDVDRMIDYCNQTGLKQVMLSSGAWCQSVGHYTFAESRFPGGEKSLKAFVDKLHAHGIKVGMHCFASKVSKRDAYVTPVPDRRFWVDKRSTLGADITATQTEIPGGDLRQWPGSSACTQKYWEGGIDKHQEVILDDEIIQYKSIGPEGKWDTFMGCTRGAWGTKAAAHRGGTDARHYGVDGCINGYIIDQETTLLEETTTRLASIFNNCGFDMIYFDGGEDVDRTRFNYYVSGFQEMVMKKITKRPIIHMGTCMTHWLWPSFARSATVDVYLATLHGAIQAGYKLDKWPTVRDHINKSVAYMLSIKEDMMPGELGWFGIWPKQPNTDGLQLDEIEYLMCKSLGYDAPISLETSFGQMESHPLTPGVLEIVRAYETLRMARQVDEKTREPLRAINKDFALIQDGAKRQFVPVEPVAGVAGGSQLRAEAGATASGSVATLWHWRSEAECLIPLNPKQVRVLDIDGRPVPAATQEGKLKLTVGNRRLALVTTLPLEQLTKALQEAQATQRQAQRVWIQAEAGKLVGEMALGSTVGVSEPGSFGDVVVCTGTPSYTAVREWYAEYTVNIPRAGAWHLWSRVQYPGGGDQSFGLWIPPAPASLAGGQALGNCGLNEGKWHWTGRGGGSTTPPPGTPIRLMLPKGPFTFRVLAREGSGRAAVNPRLDVMLLTDDLEEEPTDELARRGLGL